MSEPAIASKTPFPVDVEEGKVYSWCACGLSNAQPLCDGSHKGSGMSPVRYRAEKTGTLYFCGCKHTGNQPRCDGTHKGL
ncbi:MAG: CDGSH iron-sulfur domain-containing protein [Pseudohongiellaceae bacterium]